MKVKFMLFIAALFYVSAAISQKVGTTYTPITSQSAYFDVSLPLTEIGAILPKGAAGHHLYKQNREIPQLFEDKIYNNRDAALPQGNDPIWQQTMGPKGMSNPLVNFEGTRNDDNAGGMVAPPDTDGDVGPNNYFQMCNTIFQIFDKQGNSLFGPADNSTIWSGFIGSWTGTNDGDPIVLYDQQADRWLVSQFAVNCSDGTYWELVAVSTTSNPTGSYYRYAFQFNSFPDYPKFGIWRDGYYLMVQHGGGTVTAAALNRTQMLAGTSPAQMVTFNMPNLSGSGFIGMLPSDNDGQWAPVGTPNYFVYFNDDAWNADPDQLKIWSFSVNWTNTGLSTLSLTTNLPTAAFSSEFGTHLQGIIPQPGTTQKLAVMEKALMNRMQYRNFGTYQSMLCCHTVDVDGANRAGMRWYELRRTTGAWSIYQQGTYAPGTTDNYWMGSIAQNGDGDIALGFSVSSATRYPSIHYTGRNPNDPLGQMTLGEKAIITGANSQNGTARWGDYTMMSVDPSDDETFWYTNEYLGNYTFWGAWITQIASFKLGDNCAASGGCSEYISRVQAGTINNPTACSGYGDYTATHSTNLPVNGVVHVNVTNGSTSYAGDQCGIWVDWNRNGSFYDAGEQMTVTGTPGVGPYTATIIPPAGQTVGSCIMRIRITWTGTLDPCGTTGFGEVEDYTLNITAKASNVWTGNFNHYWENAGNWSLEHIPTADENVIIPNVNMPLWVDYYNANCNNLTTYAGTTLLVRGWALTVNGDMSISGQFAMDNSAGKLYAMGDVYWESGSTANISAASVMWIYGFWEFRSGANVQLANGYVDFAGNTDTYIRTYAPNCSFYNVGVYKTVGHFLGLSYLSTNDLTINGYLGIQPNASFSGASTHSLFLRGAFYNNYHFAFDNGTLVMDGANQSITPGIGDYLNNLTISPTGTTTVENTYTNTLTVKGSVSIQSGVFDPLNNTVEVRGNWTNSIGSAGFTEGTGKVTFNSAGNNYVLSNETFYTVEAKMGGALYVNNPLYTVNCSFYDWTTGGINVQSGTFTANNLVDNGLYGSFSVSAGGTLNLNNPDGWVDLDGNLYIYGGNFNVYGGTTDSDWSYSSNASLTMSGGVLDFKTRGIRVYNSGSFSFTSNVTSGTIRTVGKFDNQRSTFAPTGGTIEMYGSVDAAVSTGAGCSLYNLLINKSVTDISSSAIPLFDKEGNLIEQPLSNTASATGSLVTLTGDLTVQSGTFDLNTCTVNVTGDAHVNNATLKMTNAADKLTCSSINWNSGSNDNINNGEIDVRYWNFRDGTNAMLSAPNLAVVQYGISPEDSDAEFGNFKATASSKSMDNSSVYYPVRVTGNCTFATGATWYTNVDWLIGGNLNIENTASFMVYSGANILVNGNFTLDGTLGLSSGASALVHGDFIFPNTGVLNGYGGTFTNDYSLSNLTLSGTLQVSSGFVEFPNRNVFLSSTFNDQITGGTMKFGRTFAATLPGVFQPTGGTVEFINASAGNYVQVTSDNFLNDVIINKPGSSYQVYNDLTIKGNLTFNAGTLAAGDKTIYVGGNWNNLVGSSGFNEGTGTVVFNGALAADVLSAETFYNLNLNKTYTFYDGLELFHDVTVSNDLHNIDGSMKLKDPAKLYVTGNVSIDLGGGLNASDYYASSLSGPQITVGRNWTNANADHTSEHGFDPGSYSTVTFNGTADQFLTTACAKEDFNNLKIDKTTGSFRPNDNTQSYGNILIQQGSWEDNVSGLTHTVYGNFTVPAAGSFLTTSIANTVEFKGSQNSVLSYSGGLGYFRNLLVNKTPGYSVTQATDVYTQFGGNLTVGTGTYNLGGNFLMAAGDITVNNTGILSLPAASIMALTDTKTLNVNSGGRIEIAGTSGNKVNIRSNAPLTARYAFNVNSGGAIAADYCIFKNMGVSGINIKSGASIDLAHPFKGCTFQDGASGGTLLTIDNSETRTIRNAVFPTNIWGGASNVTKSLNAGFVYFVDYSGLWSGEANDNDVNNRLNWVPTLIAAPTATPSSICVGSSSQLYAVASGGIAPYSYLWSPAGTLSNATSENPVAVPAVTTTYTVQVTDALGTTGTGNVTVTVLPFLTPSVSIVASANPCAPGDFVLFTATPVNGGTSPTYVWKINGSPVGTGPTFSTSTLNNHDEVTCVMTSNYPCVTGNPATSNAINMVVIPANRTETGTINAPLSLCFDASNTITVAGGGTVFIVKSGASAVFIAGVNILFLPGTTVENGGYMHGYIATTNNYCGFAPAPMPSVIAAEGEVQTEPSAASQMFSIYPNPTTGKFTLKNRGNLALNQVQVEIYDLRGNKVFSTSYAGERSHQIILPAFLPGLYFVKVTAGDQLESFKLVVTR